MGETAAKILGNPEKEQKIIPELLSKADQDSLIKRILEIKSEEGYDEEIPEGVVYNGLLWELYVPRIIIDESRGAEEKEVYAYEAGLEVIKDDEDGSFERYPRPVEVYSLLIDYLEGKIKKKSELQKLIEDMITGENEWLSMAMQRKKDKIIFYVDPENIILKGYNYIIDGNRLKCSDQKEFDLPKTIYPNGTWISLYEFDEEVFEFLYHRKINDLPKFLKKGDAFEPGIHIPRHDGIFPLIRRQLTQAFDICSEEFAAARGVYVIKNKK